MIGTTLEYVNRARSSKARPLALFLMLSLMLHGLFFPQEWLLFSLALSGYVVLANSSGLNLETETDCVFGPTDVLFWGMFCFSVLGLAYPVKVKDGFLEALSWGIFWLVYRLGMRISAHKIAKQHLTQSIEWLAIVVALIGWLPWVTKVSGRLSSLFGYANAAATFLGAALLLCPATKLVRIFLGISLLGTGSRAGAALFLIIFTGQQLLIRLSSRPILPLRSRRQRGQVTLEAILAGIAGLALMMLYNKPAWENLTTGGFQSSSWMERLFYYKDGISLAWRAGGLPRAGGWMAFPTVQQLPYWTADPHSSLIHILLDQGLGGILSIGVWGAYLLAQAWKTWVKVSVPSARLEEEVEGTKVEVRVWGTLLFLVLHSFVDADFSFGALGVLFWMLLGSIQARDVLSRSFLTQGNKLTFLLRGKAMVLISLICCLLSGSALLKPTLFFEQEKVWNTQAAAERERNPAQSIALWNMSLSWDQTQISTRQELAELLLKRGNTDAGLKSVEEVLRWQPFDLAAYEWAQSVVWDAAEMQRSLHPKTATRLYLWVQGVPQEIEERNAVLAKREQALWVGYRDLVPSQHIKLLAEYARQRQLGLPLLRS